MKRFLLAGLVLAAVPAVADAGPLARLADRLRDRRAERAAPAPACRPFPAAAAPPLAAPVAVLRPLVNAFAGPQPTGVGAFHPLRSCGPAGCPVR